MRPSARLTLAAGLLAAHAFRCEVWAAGDPTAEVAAAIDQLRGIHLAGMSAAQKTALGQRLDKAWDTLFDHPEAAKKATLDILANEHDDNFLIVDLAHLLTVLDPKSLGPAAAALSRADVTAHPGGTFHAAANMAALHCGACLPAVLRILEIKDADTSIVEHALPIDQNLMLIFTVGQYGEDAVAPVIAKLSSDNCVVRSNAGLALGLLQPRSIAGEIRATAAADACDDARGNAWVALGLLDDPLLVAAATKRLAATPPASRVERLGIAHGLGSTFSLSARGPLRTLAADSDSAVASAAKQALRGFDELEVRLEQVKKQRLGASSRKRSKMIRRLEKAVSVGRIDLDEGPDDLLSTLTSADIPLLNRARAAVLNRLSDECLGEYYPMTYAVRALRRQLATGAEAPP